MRVTADVGVSGGRAGEHVGRVAVQVDTCEPALRGIKRSRSGSLHAKSKEDVSGAVGGDGRVNKDAGIERRGVSGIVGQAVKSFLNGVAGRIAVRIIDAIDRPAGARIVQASDGL